MLCKITLYSKKIKIEKEELNHPQPSRRRQAFTSISQRRTDRRPATTRSLFICEPPSPPPNQPCAHRRPKNENHQIDDPCAGCHAIYQALNLQITTTAAARSARQQSRKNSTTHRPFGCRCKSRRRRPLKNLMPIFMEDVYQKNAFVKSPHFPPEKDFIITSKKVQHHAEVQKKRCKASTACKQNV